MKNNYNLRQDISVVVDAGHGGTDPGAVNGTLREKDFNLRAANYMYERFKELGVPVAITRSGDETITPSERVDRALGFFGNGENVVLISNHINAGGVNGASGK